MPGLARLILLCPMALLAVPGAGDPIDPLAPAGAESPIEAANIACAEDTITDARMIPADLAERARWTMPETPAGPLPRWVRHRPAPRETIEQIALRHGVSARRVRDWNHLAADFQPSYERSRPKSLKVWAERLPPPRQALEHLVRVGDAWGELAHEYGVDSADLRAWNVGGVGRELDPGERLTVWIDPVVYQSIVEDPERDSGVRPGAHGVGSPNVGVLVAGVQIPDGHRWLLRYPNSAYGTTFAVRSLVRALDDFGRTSGYALPLKLGTMSRPRGGQVGHHESHQSGRDIDIRLPMRATVPQSLAPTARRVDWLATWALVQAFDRTGTVQVIFLDYAMQKRVYKSAVAAGASPTDLARLLQWPLGSASTQALVRHEPGHEQHMHVRFECGPAEPECVD